MNKSYYTFKKLFLLCALFLGMIGLSSHLNAQTLPSVDTTDINTADTKSSFAVGYGQAKGAEQVSLIYTSPVVWVNNLDNSRITLRIEGQLAQWHYKDSGVENRNLTQISVVPLFAWEINPQLSLKGGIGLGYFNRHEFGNRTLGTKLNFADIIGVGYKITPQSEIAYYYTHYSNAGIKKPNPGLDMHKIVYNHSF